MTITHWLLDHIDVPDSVVGDIAERSSGKSQWWLWRQVLGALVGDLRRHPSTALRGLTLGLLLVTAVDTVLRPALLPLDEWLGRIVYDYLLVGRTNMILLVSLANALLLAPCWFAIGWLVARVSARYIALLVLALIYAAVLPHDIRQLVLAFPERHSMRLLTIDSVSMAIWLTSFTTALLAGALWWKKDTHAAA